MEIAMICILTIVFIASIGFEFYSFVEFKALTKKNDVISLMDKYYAMAIYVMSMLYMAMYISSMVDVFMDINQYKDGKLPFIIYTVPIMVISFRILVNEGLYAYSRDRLFIGGKKSFYKEEINIDHVYKNSLTNRGKIIVVINNNKTKDKKYVIRMSLDNVDQFIRQYQKV